MKKIFQIYRTDWQRIFSVPTGILLTVAIMILPSVYAWVNIKAMWDPYKDTSQLKVAVTNLDKGGEVRGRKLAIGEELVDHLKENKKLGWTFVSREEAERGVKHGEYYASLLIPPDFSSKIASVLSKKPNRAEIIYIVNEKLNAVAPKITEKGAAGVVGQISENFTRAVNEAVLTEFNKVGIELERELPTIRNIESKIFALEKRLPELREMGNQVLVLDEKMPEIREKSEKIVALERQLPKVSQLGNSIIKVEERLPKLREAGNEVLLIQKKLPVIQLAAKKVVEMDANFYKVEQALNKGIEDAQKANEIIKAAQQELPKTAKMAEGGSAFASQLNEFLQRNDGAFNAVAPVIKQNVSLLQQTADSTAQLIEAIQMKDYDPQKIIQTAEILKTRLQTGSAVMERTTSLLTRLNRYTEGSRLSKVIGRLNEINQNFQQQTDVLDKVETAIKNGQEPTKEQVEWLRTLAVSASGALGNILEAYDTEIVPGVNQSLAKLKQTATASSEALEFAKAKLPDIQLILRDAQSGVQFGLEELERMKSELPRIQKEVHQAASAIGGKMDKFTAAVNEAALFVKNDLASVEEKVHKAADFVRNDLPTAEQEIRKVSRIIQTKLPQMEKAVDQAADLIRTDLPEIENSIHDAANKIRKFESERDLGDIIQLLKNDVKKESDFLTKPIQLKEERMFPIPNYGSAMSPFYTTLSLWVGAMLLISLFRTGIEDVENTYRSYHVYFGRLLTFLTIGIFQGFIVSLGDIFLLHAYVVEKFWFVLFAILTSIVFVTITYTLVSVFGNIGKGLAIIILVLQFSSSGGTFPVSLTPMFFQKVNPFVPFTYAVSLLREAVGGIVPDIVQRDLLALLFFFVIMILFALAFKKPLSGITSKLAKNAEKTKILS
ncbi:YhgE/Pip domain-containing protein [Pseudobacillus wudalianchiensis]|uniref:Phage infection protein n=1 Tax=Pseudobacillus wudalianchiensis TaxID=1743143 RepID=A0A1B9AIQ7_9BACI|nr:YhgE/Pip domain-containing protein [Bacillus wudalianchiensis]OCA83718.1 phage infection protein [Bacillus wudalianchiensis]